MGQGIKQAATAKPYRILIVDDTPSIHEDFYKILVPEEGSDDLRASEAALFGESSTSANYFQVPLELISSYQGQEALDVVKESVKTHRPFAIAFVDMRMPPGWDGVKTIEQLWQVDEYLQIVICSAYSDYNWSQIAARLGSSDRLLILKKPFEDIEIIQLTHALTAKWTLMQQSIDKMNALDKLVQERTAELKASNDRLAKEKALLEQAEMELRLAQKLEAVGQLAAGIAHEINTPAQYVGDHIEFLISAFNDLGLLIERYQHLHNKVGEHDAQALLEDIDQLCDDVDLPFLLEEVPVALKNSVEGVSRISSIVKAMKEFSHPGSEEKLPHDINKAILNTLEVTQNEYKYVAEVKKNLNEIPKVNCFISDLNQVFLNMIVNAAHAIEEKNKKTESNKKGVIEVSTYSAGDKVLVEISDTGSGIPENVRGKIFDPFFTTKPVGKGTGQGLAIAHNMIVEKHDGQISFESVEDQGTVFKISIPVNQVNSESLTGVN